MTTLPLFPQSHREQVLHIIKSRTSSNPVSIATLTDRTGLSPRSIKFIVEQARVDGEPVCARRGKPNGYFWASSEVDLEESAETLKNQARRMLLAAGKLVGRKRIREYLGQLIMENETGQPI